MVQSQILPQQDIPDDCTWKYYCLQGNKRGRCTELSAPELICETSLVTANSILNVQTCQNGFKLDQKGKCRKIWSL